MEARKTLLIACLLGGCASQPQPEHCQTVDCLMKEQTAQIAKGCYSDLFWYRQKPRSEQRLIDQTYRYPLTDVETYTALAHASGSRAVSPRSWCRAFARAQMQVRVR